MKYLLFAISSFAAAAELPVSVVNPVADTTIRSTDSSTDFGRKDTIVSNNANGTRIAFLRFDLRSTRGENLTYAELSLVAASAGGAKNTFHVYGLILGKTWIETDGGRLVWSNASAQGIRTSFTSTAGALSDCLDLTAFYGRAPLANFTTTADQAGAVDIVFKVTSGIVLEFINKDPDRLVTFVIAEQDPADSQGNAWYSGEASTWQPELRYSTAR